MRLLFEWIKNDEYQVFNDCGINFTDDYDIAYDSKTKVLLIRERETQIPRNFYSLDGSNVVSQVTCILGRNGVGKSSLLRHLYKTDNMDMQDENRKQFFYWNTIQVFEMDESICIYHNQQGIAIDSSRKYVVNPFYNEYYHVTKLFFVK